MSDEATTDEVVCRWGTDEDTSWPVPIMLEWRLRYTEPTRELMLAAASVVAAYSHLVDRSRSQADAVGSLKRARRVAAREWEALHRERVSP